MAEKYKFKDRAWDVTHKDGRHLDTVTVHGDDVREAHQGYKQISPSTHEDEILNNALWKVLDRHKLQPDDIEINEKVDKPNKVIRKASGGRVGW